MRDVASSRAASVVLLACAVGAVLNLRHGALLIAARTRVAAPPAEHLEHPPTPVPPPPVEVAAPPGAQRLARVSSAGHAADAPLFQQLGLELDELVGGGQRPRRRGWASTADASDLLVLEWRSPAPDNASARSALRADGTIRADVLWGQWTSHLQFFDGRLRAGHLINSLMGLEHDTRRTGPHMLHCHAVHLPLGALLSPCTVRGSG